MKTCCDAPVGYNETAPLSQWQGWNGGECPVHPLATVEYVMKKVDGIYTESASDLDWEKSGDDWDIIVYRVVKEYRDPREVWLTPSAAGSWVPCRHDYPNATLFREVLE